MSSSLLKLGMNYLRTLRVYRGRLLHELFAKNSDIRKSPNDQKEFWLNSLRLLKVRFFHKSNHKEFL